MLECPFISPSCFLICSIDTQVLFSTDVPWLVILRLLLQILSITDPRLVFYICCFSSRGPWFSLKTLKGQDISFSCWTQWVPSWFSAWVTASVTPLFSARKIYNANMSSFPLWESAALFAGFPILSATPESLKHMWSAARKLLFH